VGAQPTGPSLPGLDLPGLTAWIDRTGCEVGRPRRVWLISGGRSNLTFGLEGADGCRYCLRRPPLGKVLPSAHDVVREFRILSSLQGGPVPVPRTVAVCEDAGAIGAQFYLMEFVEGHIVGTVQAAGQLPLDVRAGVGRAMAGALTRIHAVDLPATGLDSLSKGPDYASRQLRRWQRQLGERGLAVHPLLKSVADRLSTAVPPQRVTTLVHGDFKVGNMVLGDGGTIRAVLDWELATLGDPIADLGWLLASWSEPGEQVVRIVTPPSQAGGFAARAELVADYRASSPLDISDLPYYTALAEWKWAAIDVGVYDRFASGQMGDASLDRSVVLGEIESRLAHADDLLRHGS
jgi:aminoglycoside phosphotransferase (APT) family kinase protein